MEKKLSGQGMFWLNVDFPTRDAKLHTAVCGYAARRRETPRKGVKHIKRDGGWLPFASKSDAKGHLKKCAYGKQIRLSFCRHCKP